MFLMFFDLCSVSVMAVIAFPTLKYLMSARIFSCQFSSPSLCSVGHISGSNDLESEIVGIDEGTVHNPLADTLF